MRTRSFFHPAVLCAAVLLVIAADVASAEEKKKDPVLDRPLPKVDLGDVTVVDVVNFLQDISGKKVDWKAMQDAGIDADTSVTFTVESTTFGKAVKRLFFIAGADAEPDVTVEGGTVVVKPAKKKQ